MAVSAQFRDFVLDQLADLGGLDTRRMFGGLSLRRDGLHFAVLIDDTLYLSCDGPLRADLHAAGGTNFSYTRQARTIDVPRLVSVPEDILEDRDALLRLARAALAAAQRGA